jgi:hypothetical protein
MKKPATYAQFKSQRDAVEASRADAKAKGIFTGISRPNPDSAALLQQFFALRYDGVPMSTVLKTLQTAYEIEGGTGS